MTKGGRAVNEFWPNDSRRCEHKRNNKEMTAYRSFLRAPFVYVVFALIAALVALPGFDRSIWAQDDKDKDQNKDKDTAATIAVDVKVVTLPVTVRDKHGKIVTDLTKDDFTLQEDGRPQTVKYFSQESNLPLTLGLLVDTSRSQTNVLDAERNASRSFLDQMLVQPKDKAFLIHFDREVELLQDLTSSHEKLEAALDLLKTPSDRASSNDPNDSDDSSSGSGSGSHHSGGGTELYDAIFLGSNELMKKQPGRKAFIVLSDGVDRGSKTYLESAIESAQRADTVVYSIYFAEPHNEGQRPGRGMGRGGGGGWPGGGGGWPGGGGGYPGGGGGGGRGGQRSSQPRTDGKKILERISRETGGRFFEVSKKQTVGDIYTSIVEELRTQYSMGYTPDKDSTPTGYHHITLTSKRKDTTVQTREGYYADR
jgi:VWFA-related protein